MISKYLIIYFRNHYDRDYFIHVKWKKWLKSSGHEGVECRVLSGIQTNLEVDIYGTLAERWSGGRSKGRESEEAGRQMSRATVL